MSNRVIDAAHFAGFLAGLAFICSHRLAGLGWFLVIILSAPIGENIAILIKRTPKR